MNEKKHDFSLWNVCFKQKCWILCKLNLLIKIASGGSQLYTKHQYNTRNIHTFSKYTKQKTLIVGDISDIFDTFDHTFAPLYCSFEKYSPNIGILLVFWYICPKPNNEYFFGPPGQCNRETPSIIFKIPVSPSKYQYHRDTGIHKVILGVSLLHWRGGLKKHSFRVGKTPLVWWQKFAQILMDSVIFLWYYIETKTHFHM